MRRIITHKAFYSAVVAMLASLTMSSGARAQYVWHTTHSNRVSHYVYSFTVVSCSGGNCTAASLKMDTVPRPKQTRMIFLESTDAGETWVEQDPGLPGEFDQGQNYITSIQRIDSLNIVAVGDTGLIVRSFDGGATWVRQNIHTTWKLLDVHFSDPMTGMVLSYGDTNVHVTTDGGSSWSGVGFKEPYEPIRGHSYGEGKFRILTYDAGPVYTTYDYWKTIDTTFAFDTSDVINYIGNGVFGSGDTILAWGTHWHQDSNKLDLPRLLLTRSTDGGVHWTKVPIIDSFYPNLTAMSSPDRATMLTGILLRNGLFRSTDHGNTWIVDSLRFLDIDTSYSPSEVTGLTVMPDGKAIAIFYGLSFKQEGLLVAGVPVSSGVEPSVQPVSIIRVYPDPAVETLTILSSDVHQEIRIFDPLGRSVLLGRLDDQGMAMIDVSSLPQAIYYVSDSRSRAKFVKE
jgi:hypothetical protein